MKMLQTLAVGISFFVALGAHAQQCTVRTVDQEKIKAITEQYKKQFSEVADKAKRDGEEIQKDTPRNGSIVFDGHLETRQAKLTLPIPEVALRDTKMSMDLPETTLRTQTFSADIPTVVTGCDWRAGPDETVIEDKTCRSDIGNFDYPCPEVRTRRGADICAPTVKIENRPSEIKLDVPEVKMVRKEWIMGIPETKTTEREITFDYPVFILDKVEAKTGEVKRKSEKLRHETTTANERLSAAMKTEIRGISIGPIEDTYLCANRKLQSKQREALDQITQMMVAYEAGYKQAKASNATQAIAVFAKALTELNVARDKTLQEFSKAKTDLESKKRQALSKI